MGSVTRKRSMDDIVAELDSSAPIAVISCNNCVRASGSGGEGVWEGVCAELKERGYTVEDEVLITNPCSRGYLENLELSGNVKSVLLIACTGAQMGLQDLRPDLQIVAGTDTIGLFVTSKKDGIVKVAMTFPGYEDLLHAELKMGDSTIQLPGGALPIGEEVAS
jgi:hypothetical protein